MGTEPFQQRGQLVEATSAENVVLEREHDTRGHKDSDHLSVEVRVFGGMKGRLILGVLKNSFQGAKAPGRQKIRHKMDFDWTAQIETTAIA
jgi:hypothetical protein